MQEDQEEIFPQFKAKPIIDQMILIKPTYEECIKGLQLAGELIIMYV